MAFRRKILGLSFLVGSVDEVVATTLQGGMVVVPSAPVLVQMQDDLALRDALTNSDYALTDSGLMVLLWRLTTGEKLERVSGLEYIQLLLRKLKPRAEGEGRRAGDGGQRTEERRRRTKGGGQETKDQGRLPLRASPLLPATGGLAWIMPTNASRDRNLAWLRAQGFATTEADCYVAPFYGPGEINDPMLLAWAIERRPAHIILALGGGTQERVAWFLKRELEKERRAKSEAPGGIDGSREVASIKEDASKTPLAPTAMPSAQPLGLHCIGAAIGFLTGDQVRIPKWVDYLYLGWLWRCVSAPRRFVPRYWKAAWLVVLMMQRSGKS